MMRTQSLKTRILASMFAIIAVAALPIALLGHYIIKSNIVDRAQRKVRYNLRAARSVYDGEIQRIGEAFRLVSFREDLASLKAKTGVHYLRRVDAKGAEQSPSEIVRAALERKQSIGGTRIISNEELAGIDINLIEGTRIDIRPTARAMPAKRKALESVMAKEYAVPMLERDGQVREVIYGGRIINRDYVLVDRIRQLVFGDERYGDKPIGTVTIFQDDTRISTNVLDEAGERAIGTRVSGEVYETVVHQGRIWDDRAFVVDCWYLTAYEPVKDINGNTIGILYVGTLAKPFDAMARQATLLFMAIVAGAAALAVLLSLVLASSISRPLTRMLNATRILSGGDLGHTVRTETGVEELDKLSEAFNEMSVKLDEREERLKVSNAKLVESNKSYLELISFVAHELKGILASAVMNAYAVRDGFLGMINFKQRKALDSVTRNLDYLEATVHKFLNLGRIERGELAVNKTAVAVKKDVFDASIDSLKPMAVKKRMNINNRIDPALKVSADHDLMQIVANNLVGNAIKYGYDSGNIDVTSRVVNGFIEIEVYNDAAPISAEQKDKLFMKFSRLENTQTRKVKGTGLGLYITRQIVEKHGGRIWVEPREKGNSFVFRIERGN